ncbi:MAG: D-aminoacylase [Betaproteobacteria bacterium]|nr:MAG: D-aminoacylase [Betaproteobacteria bacterium]
MHDLVIRNAKIVDGSGAAAQYGDVAVDNGTITQVNGAKAAAGRREINADGALLTPGWVDVHTHYDGQATWDPYLSPSSWHGVTSVVMGNCGVGFAPVKPQMREWLIQLMEGVEDIPNAALSEGIDWQWETFPEYMNALERMPRALDIGCQVPHGALRPYVMGENGVDSNDATSDEIAAMRRITREALEAGALGFSTSRTLIHKGADGKHVPGTFARLEEVFGIGRALGDAKRGVFQMTSNHVGMDEETVWMRKLAAETGQPVAFNLQQIDTHPELWKTLVAQIESAGREGVPLYGAFCGRPVGLLFSWGGTFHPFIAHPSYQALRKLSAAERLTALRDPNVRAKLLSEQPHGLDDYTRMKAMAFHKMFRLGERPDYEPDPSQSAAAIAAREGRNANEVAYDWMLADEGRAIIYFPVFNYSYEKLSHTYELLQHPRTMLSLGDGGAHCGYICDASLPTFMLTHWTRDRTRGEKLPLELIVKRQTSATAAIYGLQDRGLIKPGYIADFNLIDYDNLSLTPPHFISDLPAGGRRIVQEASGYLATIKSGHTIFENGQATGAMPGKLIRGPQRV